MVDVVIGGAKSGLNSHHKRISSLKTIEKGAA